MRRKLLLYILTAVGVVLLGSGIYGFNSLSKAEDIYEHAKGVVQKATCRRVYKHRKWVVEYEILVFYDTPKYGRLTSYLKSSVFFFLSEGDEVDMLYHPDHPRDVRYPVFEKVLYATLCILGVAISIGIFLYLFIGRTKKRNNLIKSINKQV